MVIKRGPFSGQPLESTPFGDQKKFEFMAGLYRILGDARLIWTPDSAETTTSTDLSLHGATITYNATFAGQYAQLGTGLYATFDGTTDEADVPYNARYFFGDGSSDEPFTINALVFADDATPTAATAILSVWNKDTDGEQRHYQTLLTATNGYPRIEIYDESANAYIGREDQTALTVSTWTLLTFRYDGTEANGGIDILKNAAVVDDADSSSGSYLAMEDPGSAEKLLIGHTLSAAGTPVAEEFWAGRMALITLSLGAQSTEETWALKEMINGYFDLAL